ncbi:unnamed protein product [Blepharisma stoltei]|uniref:Tetratricopeptide repeat protein n=1 Tax=Blepharisma stoltei TaxID=1481888 RepID=A0AAU9ICC2_9CILI|nr:unnamed protein product [Blepharisma stoltei]
MTNRTLRKRIGIYVLVPLLLGIILISLASSIPLYVKVPKLINDVVDNISDDQNDIMETTSIVAASVVSIMLQKQINILIIMKTLMDKYYNKNLSIKENWVGNKSYVNAYKLAQTLTANNSWGRNFETSMWYLGQKITEEDQLDADSKEYLYDQTIFDSFLRPVGQIDKINNEVYTAYDSNGFFYYIPSSYQQFFLSNSTNCYNATGFEPRCRPWYAAVRSSNYHEEVILTLPYLFAETNTLGQTACDGFWSSNINLYQATCLDYKLDKEQVSNLPENSYAFILDDNLKVFYHPKLNRSDSNVYRISDLEFGLDDYSNKNSELNKFESKILPLFEANISQVSHYTNHGESILIGVSPVFLKTQLYSSPTKYYSIGIALKDEKIKARLLDLRTSIQHMIIYEGVFYSFFVIIVGVIGIFSSRVISRSITEPLDELSKIIDRLLVEDLEVKIPDKEEYTELIQRLFKVFKGLKTVLRFRKQGGVIGNEAEMLIQYADSFTLFNQYYNLRGMEICMSRIAYIHYSNKRYVEAQEAMQMALAITVKMQQKLSPSYIKMVKKLKEQLADILIDSSLETKNKHWPTIISLLSDLENSSNTRIKLKLSLALAKGGKISEAQEKLAPIEEELDENSPYAEMFLYLKGVLLSSVKKFRSAALIFKQCLELNSHYDPWVRKACLIELKNIFINAGIKKDKVKRKLKWDKNFVKEVVLLHDYGITIKGPKNLRALKCFSTMIDSLSNNDKVSFVLSSKLPEIVFKLSLASKNTAYMKNAIMACDSPHGSSCIYDGISAAIMQFNSTDVEKEGCFVFDEKKHSKAIPIRWIIAVSNGEDFSKKHNPKTIRNLLIAYKCGLVIIGFSLKDQLKNDLLNLCDSIPNGYFIDCKSNRIAEAFQEAIEAITAENIILPF